MYKTLTIKNLIRVPPEKFTSELKESLKESIKEEYENKLIDNNIFIISLVKIITVGEGHIIPNDGAIYYETTFKILIYQPFIKEIIEGTVNEITDFGAFIRMGPIEGLSHVSQVMDDYVSFSKSKSLQGKKTKRTLNTGDVVRARVIAISMKDLKDTKIGITMRQKYLGKIEWIKKDKEEEKEEE